MIASFSSFSIVFNLAALLASASIINQCNKSGFFAVCIDGGPGTYTSQLLSHLKQKKAKATFHLSAKYLTDPHIQSLIQQISSDGHLIGLSVEASSNLLSMQEDQIKNMISRQANVLASFTGYYPKFVRLPYQGWDDKVLRAVEATGAIVTVHNLESFDYTNDANRILNSYQLAMSLSGNGEGSFISVQHDSSQQSISVIPKVIDMIRGNGYEMVTLDKCLSMGDLTKNKTPLKGAGGKVVSADPMDVGKGGKMPSPGGNAGGNRNDDMGSGMNPSMGDEGDDIGSGKLGNNNKNGASSDMMVPILSSYKALMFGLIILGLTL